ncbi:hypothetical protein ACQ4M4_13805 [Leptolyngbya sp. AN02str]|uniref:hypothetical protein n=1 Tax=Leptolyngbya sp. AN02str TaxID=3423363 RepID=UPI003D31E270
MSTQDQARALMVRHHQLVKNRQQSMLGRVAAEIGCEEEVNGYWNSIQGQPHPTFSKNYDRSGGSMS